MMPDGETRAVHAHASLKLQLQSFKKQLVFKVIDFGIPFDALLRDAFLKRYKVIMNYSSETASLWKLQNNFVIGSMEQGRQVVQDTGGNTEVNNITAVQAKRALRECHSSFVAFVSHVAKEEQPEYVSAIGPGPYSKTSGGYLEFESAPEYASIASMNEELRQYAYVFATELLEGVPQGRGAFETLPLEPGAVSAVPPFRYFQAYSQAVTTGKG